MVELFNEVLGKGVRIPEKPERIISFSPAVTESLFEIGLGDALVGVSAFCARPDAVRLKRRVGSYNTASEELLAELRPDLIFTVTGYQRDFAVALSKRFPVYPLELPVSVAGIADLVVKTGLVAGAPEAARDLAGRLLRRLAGLRRLDQSRVYVEIDLGGPVSFGAHSYIADAIRLLGSASLFEEKRVEWLTPNLDEVRALDPDVIVYEPKMYSRFDAGGVGAMIQARGWEGIKAVRLGNFFVTPGPLDFLAHHGPSFITEALPWLEERLGEAASRARSY